jgi:integrase/recombinase XerD
MLKAQRRHRPPCKRSEWDQGYTKCVCPIVIRGTLTGKPLTVSTAKFLPPDKARDLEAARNLAILWEKTGTLMRPEEYAQAPADPAAKPEAPIPTVEMAVAAFMADARDRGNSVATVYKKHVVFESALLRFCACKGIRFVSELDLNTVREWRSGWNLESLSRSKRQGQVIGFMWFCERAGWLPRNSASDITRGLGKIQVKATQTGYFQPEEYKAVIDATYVYSDRPRVDSHNSLTIGGERIRALTELMRWTGLRIRDAVTLEKRRLALDPNTGMSSVMVYQKKTGDPVYCPIPPDVAAMLLNVPASQKGNTNATYFFWTGEGLAKTVTSNWQRSYVKLFKLAALKEPDGTPKRCHPHMLRDTFAVESLLSGMRLEEVSTILGHSSVKITERHYMPWVRARQTSLNQSVMASWIKQGKVTPPVRPRGPKKAPVLQMPVAVGV